MSVGKVIFVLLVFCFTLSACAPVLFTEQEQGEMWAQIQKEYPQCKGKAQPKVIYTSKLDNLGVYYPFTNSIKLLPNMSSRILEHEYRHACGDPNIE
jgi:hypothetical protein